MPRRLTLVLAEDHHLVRAGLRMLLEARLDCAVVGEAADGPEAVDLAREHQPDLLIVDLALPRMNGIEVIRAARAESPQTRAIVLSMHGDEAYVREAIRAGAHAYVLKDSLADDFLHAVSRVATGQRYLSPSLAQLAISNLVRQEQGAGPLPIERLTPRERQVLLLVAQGHTSAAIAARLGIGVRTVEWHRARILHRLGLNNVAELVRYAIQQQLLSPPEPPPGEEKGP